MNITRVFRNTSKERINVVGVAEIPAGGQVSISGENLPAVVLENYPGLIEVTDEEVNPTVNVPKKEAKK